VDETAVRLWDLPLYHWRIPKAHPKGHPSTRKYLDKINVWGGISYQGPTEFAVIFS
jgi:hypothetical protein